MTRRLAALDLHPERVPERHAGILLLSGDKLRSWLGLLVHTAAFWACVKKARWGSNEACRCTAMMRASLNSF